MALKTYLIERTDAVDYDEYTGFVIAAASPSAVRKLAADEAGDEGEKPWLDTAKSKVTMVAPTSIYSHHAHVVLSSYQAG